jgi:hypothetical protein
MNPSGIVCVLSAAGHPASGSEASYRAVCVRITSVCVSRSACPSLSLPIPHRTTDWIKVKCATWREANSWRHDFFGNRNRAPASGENRRPGAMTRPPTRRHHINQHSEQSFLDAHCCRTHSYQQITLSDTFCGPDCWQNHHGRGAPCRDVEGDARQWNRGTRCRAHPD